MEQYECQVLLGQILRTIISFKMDSLPLVQHTVVELYMSLLRLYPLVIADFKITMLTMEEQSMLGHHTSQLMDQHLMTTEYIVILLIAMEEEFILPHQPL